MMILQPRSKNPRELLLRAAVFVVLSLFSVMHHADAASSPQTPAQSGEVQVFASADESSPVIESVADGKSLLPIAEMTGAGGLKWFMVKTRNGNVGWIKAGDKMGAAKIDDHFRSLPKDSTLVGPVSGGPEPVSTTPATGAITIPVKIDGPVPAPGTIVTADGREVGEMRSSREGLGLALLRIEPVVEGKHLKAGDTTIRATRPGWMRFDDD